jgi:hypothetical protein
MDGKVQEIIKSKSVGKFAALPNCRVEHCSTWIFALAVRMWEGVATL